MIGVGDALITEIAQGLNITAMGVSDGQSWFHLPLSFLCQGGKFVERTNPSLCPVHSYSINYLATYLCVPSISTKVFCKGIFKGLTISM